jgi:Lar family restriction alleviation protein
MTELKPCPFCGGTPALQSWTPDDGDDHAHWIECQSCKIEQMALFDTPAEAIAAWNRRAAPEVPSDAVVERLRAWDDMITNCAGVPQNPDSLPMMLRHEIRTMIAALRPDGQTGGK